MRFDGYIRVSDTKGRSGERFLSPDIQRDTIRRLAAAKGVELNEPIVEELDVSGGKRIADREQETTRRARRLALFKLGLGADELAADLTRLCQVEGSRLYVKDL
jgi:hypothetical protein